jgi:molybdate transport system substrate-binding protein
VLGVGALASGLSACRGGKDHRDITIGAASSLRNVVPKLIAAYRQQRPEAKIRVAYGASGDLQKRVVDGAPFDGVMFAAATPVDDLVTSGHVEADSRVRLATNELVLIGPRDARALSWQTIDQLPGDGRLCIGQPESVPAGRYAREALQRLGKWAPLHGRLVFAGNVASVLAYARRGEVAAAVVYATELEGIDDVVVLDRARGEWAPTAEVVGGVVTEGTRAGAAGRFLDFAAGEAGQAVLRSHGFGAP